MSRGFPGKNDKLSRRDALKFLGAGAAATFSPASSLDLESADQGEPRHVDVIIVGGFAGLTAARSLMHAGKNG